MEVSKAFMLWLLMQQFVVVLTRFQRRWEEEYRSRQMEEIFFMEQLNAQCFAFLNRKRRKPKRSCWVKTRCQHWWETTVQQHFTEEDWLNNFRMSLGTFRFICDRLRPYLEASEFFVRQPMTVEKKVAIALYKLASCGEYRVIANQFSTSKSVVHNCVHTVCEAIMSEFKEDFLCFPNETEAIEISHAFEDMCGIPNIIGAIDGTHIPILAPSEGYRDYVNRKGWTSLNMMAVVDHLYRFRYATCKHPGSTHDAAVLKDSYLYQHSENLVPKNTKEINGTNIPYMVIGDPAYPLLPWLLKGYKGNVSPEEESFNVYLNRGRVVVENAFGRLKARFRCLLKRIDIHHTFVPTLVTSCLILHNIVEMHKDTFQQNWLEAVKDADVLFSVPATEVCRERSSLNMSRVRDALREYMSKNFPMKQSRL